MAIVLGIHHGHHASCAVVRDGTLVAAVEQERVTRVKADGQEGLSNRLPLRVCLETAGVSLADVDLIVSSFQAATAGGVGLHRPLIENGFDLFDPWENRHVILSHHLAHGLSALGTSGYPEATVLVCDLAGSTTADGTDFAKPFRVFKTELESLSTAIELRTECLSIYRADRESFALKHREYCIPHSTPDVFVHNAASLYDNVARMIFRKENAHGQLMALASLAPDGDSSSEIKATDIVEITPGGAVHFRNDWQHRMIGRDDDRDYAPLASAVQQALQTALLQYARKARELTESRRLVAAGGVFLNILANSDIVKSGLFDEYHVPSSPHDAGIAIGCAYGGFWDLARRRGIPLMIEGDKSIDRLGPRYELGPIDAALVSNAHVTHVESGANPTAVAQALRDGQIIARCSGRSEFGPRALGGRSLLASPLLSDTKDRLNSIKGRQPWRPVAPIILHERIGAFFEGPADSPYMNFAHQIAAEHRHALRALRHPDGSTRAQTLRVTDDPDLYAILREFERLTGFPILVNTSLNGPGEPIVETPEQALEFFNTHQDVDGLLLENRLVRHLPRPSWQNARLAPDAIVSMIYPLGTKRIFLIRRSVSLEISEATFAAIEAERTPSDEEHADPVRTELVEAVRLGLCVPALAERWIS